MFRKHLILTGAHNVQLFFFFSCKWEHKLTESGALFALKKILLMIPIKYSTCILVDSVCFKWFYHQMAFQNTLMKATWLKNAIPVSKKVWKCLYIGNRTKPEAELPQLKQGKFVISLFIFVAGIAKEVSALTKKKSKTKQNRDCHRGFFLFKFVRRAGALLFLCNYVMQKPDSCRLSQTRI